MLEIIQNHIDKMLQKYTQGEYFEVLKNAKEIYMSLTGKLDEDQSEFESRMNCFNDWYLFQYKDERGGKFVEHYLKTEKLTPEVSQALLNVNFSLFEYTKINFQGQIVLKDILHGGGIALTKEQKILSLVEGDLFMGRSICFKGENILLRGVTLLPSSMKSAFSIECKKILKQNSFEAELKFLLHLESLVTKSMNYHHIGPEKIFVFN